MIVGIVGMLGAGKGTVTEYLVKNKGFAHVAVSDTFLVGESLKRGLEPNRQSRHDIANEYRTKGPTKLMEACYELALPFISDGRDVVIEPQHSIDEVTFIQSKGGIVIGVDADIHQRYDRIYKRGSTKDNVSFEEFKAMEDLEMSPTHSTTNNLSGAKTHADIHVMNDGSIEELHKQLDDVFKKLGQGE